MLFASTQRLARRAVLAAPPFLLALAILLGSSYRAATREEAASLLSAGETALLQELMTPRGVFRKQPHRIDQWLKRTGARRVVHGHTPRPDGPEVRANRINLDTGVYFTGVLTAVRLQGETRRFLQAAV